jgi:hypothetical protein
MNHVKSVLAGLALVSVLHAQGNPTGTAAISGTVQDRAGTAVRQATVSVRNEASGAVQQAGPLGRLRQVAVQDL